MHVIHSEAKTESASKYLQQLCKHFAHKVPCEWTPQIGQVNFPFGLCQLQVENGTLTIVCSTSNEANLPRLQGVIDSHIKTFAWREKLQLEWQIIQHDQ